MVPNFGKSHFVEIGRPVFSAVGKLWVVSLALGTRTQRRVARSSYTTGSTTPPRPQPKPRPLLKQMKCSTANIFRKLLLLPSFVDQKLFSAAILDKLEF